MLPPIYNILSADSAVAAIVGTRIYPHGEAPQNVNRPYVTWFLVASVPENDLGGAPDIDKASLQIDSWHPGSVGVLQLAQAVRDAMQPHAVITAFLLNEREPETKLYRFALQLDYLLPR